MQTLAPEEQAVARKPIARYPNYLITEDGNVISLARWVDSGYKNMKRYYDETIKKPSVGKSGYHRVMLYNEHGRNLFSIHRLVATAFIPNPDNLPQVNHKDFDKSNNRVENLEWCTSRYNVLHFRKVKAPDVSGDKNPMAVRDNETALLIFNSELSYKEISEKFGIPQKRISAIKTGSIWGSVTGKKNEVRPNLSPKSVLEIFNSKQTTKELMEKYSLSARAICRIRTGEAWANITGKVYSPKKIKKR